MSNTLARVKVLDLETSKLEPDFGFIITAGIKTVGKPGVRTYATPDYADIFAKDVTDDWGIVNDVYEELNDTDVLVTFYGSDKKFDWPYFVTRLWTTAHITVKPVIHVDLYTLAKSKFKLSRGSLDVLARFLNCPIKKTPLNGKTWMRAAAGYGDAIEEVKEHNIRDVLITEWVYNELAPLYQSHPYLYGRGTTGQPRCPRDGQFMARVNTSFDRARTDTQVWQCRTCGGYDRR